MMRIITVQHFIQAISTVLVEVRRKLNTDKYKQSVAGNENINQWALEVERKGWKGNRAFNEKDVHKKEGNEIKRFIASRRVKMPRVLKPLCEVRLSSSFVALWDFNEKFSVYNAKAIV